MSTDLSGKRIAILVDNYFEEEEMTRPLKALKDAGAKVDLIAAEAIDGQVQGLNHIEKGKLFKIDKSLEAANSEDYDVLILPGGAVNADKLRAIDKANEWVRNFISKGKPLAVICHAPWLLASAGVAEGRRLTSFPTIKDDLKNAGADWLDEEVVIDGSIITSRKPSDIPAFNKAIISLLV
jgi:protease I